MSDDTAQALLMGLVVLTSESKHVPMKPNRNKIINNYKSN